MKHSIAITFDTASLSHYTDSFLATLWHVSQANPAPIDDKEAGEIAEQIGREIIRRFLVATPPDLWAHQGREYYWCALAEHCRLVDGKWVPKLSDASEAASATPACKDCMHCRTTDAQRFAICAAPEAQQADAVQGTISPRCTDARSGFGACGPKAVLFSRAIDRVGDPV